jgi:hypothetical protein
MEMLIVSKYADWDLLLSPREQRLQSFLLGGLIFGGYAQQLSIEHETADFQAEHVLQPKRSQLFLASVLGDVGRTTTEEPLLIQRLRVTRVSPAT